MELKRGYIQTEIGVIPEDWTVKELGEIAEFANGKPNEQNVVVNGKYLLVTLDSINIRGELKSSHKQTNLFDDSLRAGDIVTVLSDLAHGDLLGLCGVIPLDHKYVLNQRMGRIRVHSGYDPGFIRLKVNRDQNHFKKRGQGTSQRHIYRRDFDCLKIGLPNSVAEQKAIAKALSDVDALIDSLEALLTKKRNIKTGVMQELLTGRIRLPGFIGDWKEVRLGDRGYIFGGLTGKSSEDFGRGNANYITFMNVISNVVLKASGIERVSVGVGEHQSAVLPGDLLFNGSSETPEEVGFGSVVPQVLAGMYLNSFCFGFRPNEDSGLESKFFAYLTRSSLGREIIRPMAQGSTRYNLAKTNLLNGRFPLPRVQEQKAIANVLSDIDDEIEALEKRLAKTRDLKQGMAQELLTGRTRLV
jgi:type I restriction enzyme S subunit